VSKIEMTSDIISSVSLILKLYDARTRTRGDNSLCVCVIVYFGSYTIYSKYHKHTHVKF